MCRRQFPKLANPYRRLCADCIEAEAQAARDGLPLGDGAAALLCYRDGGPSHGTTVTFYGSPDDARLADQSDSTCGPECQLDHAIVFAAGGRVRVESRTNPRDLEREGRRVFRRALAMARAAEIPNYEGDAT